MDLFTKKSPCFVPMISSSNQSVSANNFSSTSNIFDTPTQYRIDGVYGMQWAKKLCRMAKQKPDLQFDGTPEPGNAHCLGGGANSGVPGGT